MFDKFNLILTTKNVPVAPQASNSQLNLEKYEESLLAHRKIVGSTIFQYNNDLHNDPNHVIKNYYQIGIRDYKNFSIFQILDLCWGRLFFYELRTIRQLGYIVWANTNIIDNIMVTTFYNHLNFLVLHSYRSRH